MPSRLDDLEAAAGITPQACIGGLFFYGGVADKVRKRPETYPGVPVPESSEFEDPPPKQEP